VKQLNAVEKRQAVLLGILVLLGIWAAFRWLGPHSLAGVNQSEEIPVFSLHGLPELVQVMPEEDHAASESSDVRNPFVFGPPPTPTPNLTPRPTLPPRPTRRPPPPRPTPTPTPKGWRKPPNFDMEYIGFFGPEDRQVAVFRKKEDTGALIDVAPVGGVIEEKFILRSIELESIVIGFVGFPEKEKTRVPLATQ